MSENTRVLVQEDERITEVTTQSGTREGVLIQCAYYQPLLYVRILERNHKISSECGHPFRLSATERIHSLVGADSFREVDVHLRSDDPLYLSNQSHLLFLAGGVHLDHIMMGRLLLKNTYP